MHSRHWRPHFPGEETKVRASCDLPKSTQLLRGQSQDLNSSLPESKVMCQTHNLLKAATYAKGLVPSPIPSLEHLVPKGFCIDPGPCGRCSR